jgi:hypothetical protein
VDIDLRAEDSPLSVWIEPWGDLIPLPARGTVRLVIDGELIESLALDAVSDGLRVSVPRFARLLVVAEDGEQLREYDTGDLPPVPNGVRP